MGVGGYILAGGGWWHSLVWPIFNHTPCFNEMFRLFLENNLTTPHQSGCKPGDSCINQLLLADLPKFINLLIMDLRLGVSSEIYLKLLIKCSTTGLSSNQNKMAFLVTC